ncbi:hypothetical protein EPN52_09645 [bacterium]|nr:MAG: hypothetical protein EPN52_09645 [bacterium]
MPHAFDNVFLPVALNVRGRRCVVIGDDAEARAKAAALRAAGADVEWLRNPSQVGEHTLAEAFLVISSPRDEELSARLSAAAERARFLLCCIDQPKWSTLAMPAFVASGPVRVAISTGGVSPTVAATFRRALARALDARFARFMTLLQESRRRIRAAVIDERERRERLRESAAEFAIEVSVSYPAWFERAEGDEGPGRRTR